MIQRPVVSSWIDLCANTWPGSFRLGEVFIPFLFRAFLADAMSDESREIYQFGAYRLDVGEHVLERLDGSENGSLPEKAFQTLVVLIRNKGRLITKNELLNAVWPDAIVEENSLGKSIHAIRHALHDSPAKPKYIETIPKHGYRFVANVERLIEDQVLDRPATLLPDRANESDGANMAGQPTPGEPSPAQGKPERVMIAVAAVLVIIVSVGAWIVWQNARSARSSAPGNSATAFARSQAYDLYVRGKVKVASENREDTEAAIKILEEAIAIDPNLAEAFALLARAYNTMAFKYSADSERKRFLENAEVAIEKALALNPGLAEAHFARGLILWSNIKGFPHELAIQSYRRSLSLDPDSDEAHHQLSLVYSHIGLIDEAEQSVKKALEINPNNTLARFRVGVYTAYRGKCDDALAVFKTIPRDVTPLLVDRSIAEVLVQTGHDAEAAAIVDEYLNRFPSDEGGSFTSVRALILAKAGNKEEAEAAIQQAAAIGSGYGHFHHTAYNIASAYAQLEEPEKAVKWLENAADSGFPNYPYFEIDPNLDNIRKHPRFVDFMNNLRPQWERFRSLS